MGPLLPLGHGGPLFLEIAMNQYINSGYQKREGLLIGYAETLTIAHDVLCVMTSRDQDGVIHAVVELLDGKGREDELARMLGGAEVSKEARAAARKLLTEA